MALSFFSGSGSASHAKYFDIRLDDQYIVFRGGEHEASSAHLRGTLVLCLSEPLTIKHLRLQLLGMSRTCFHTPSSAAGGSRKPWREQTFFERTWKFREAGKGKTEILPADNYEFPFDIVLDGSLPESVEGLTDSWVTYRFKAEIGRKYAKDIHVRKPLRIIRTLDPSALELAHAMSVENVWPNKVEYSIVTPSKAVVFGTSLQVDFRLVPLLKGLKIGQISSQLVESHELTLNPEDPESIRNTHKSTRVIVNDTHELDEEAELEILDEEAEGYQFSRHLELPKSLSKCLQDTEVKGIKIRHKLKFRVQLHNPDGHTSELRATLPVSIFISPNLPLDDNNNLIDQTPHSAQRAADDLKHQAPPLYGEHQFDQLYNDVDPSGYMTPGALSGPNTPFGSLSRNLSAENLASMAALTHADISASALHSRLSNLHFHSRVHTPLESVESGTPPDSARQPVQAPDYFTLSGGTSSPNSVNISRRHSEDENLQVGSGAVSGAVSGVATPRLHVDEVENLSRVPSYTTAVRSPARTPYSNDLPNYHAAIASDLAAVPQPQSPQRVHLRGGGGRPHTLMEPFHLPAFLHSRSHSNDGSHSTRARA